MVARIRKPGAPRWSAWFLISLALSGAAVAVVAVLAGRRVSRPMQELSQAAGRLGRSEPIGEASERGPREVRETGRAFNLLQERVDRNVRD